MFYVFGGRETRRTHKKRHPGRVLHGRREGMGWQRVEHVKHATLGVFYVFDGRGWVGMVFGGAGGQCVGSLA